MRDVNALLRNETTNANNNHHRVDDYGAVSSSSSADAVSGGGVVIVDKKEQLAKASIANEIAHLRKNLIGSGVLSLPAGLAMYNNSGSSNYHLHHGCLTSAVVADIVLTTLVAALLAYFALLIARVCEASRATTYMECWQATVGPRGASVVAIVNAISAGGGDLASATILSQTLQTLLLSFVGVRVSRLTALLVLTLVVLWPLCRLKNLHRLAPCSIFATAGMVCTALLMVIRSIDGTYAPGGIYYDNHNSNAVSSISISTSPNYQPKFDSAGDGSISNISSPTADDDDDDPHSSSVLSLLPLVSMLFSAFIMHYNCPRYYAELQDASVVRFGTAVAVSFAATALLYVVMTVAAYATFGVHCDSFILNNYAIEDPLASVGRVAVFVSTLLNYPLAFFGCRDGFANAWHISSDNTEWLTAGLIIVITVLAAFITDLAIINAVTGGIFATAIVVVFPTTMFSTIVTNDDNDPHGRRHLWLPQLLCGLGLVLGLLGAYMAVFTL